MLRSTKDAQKLIGLTGVLALALSVGACGSNNSASGDGASNSAGYSAAAPAKLVSPIDEYVNLVYGTNLSNEVRLQNAYDRVVREENHIASCMAQAGFDYTPYPEKTSFSLNEGNVWEPNNPEWLAIWGFGAIRDIGVEEGRMLQSTGERPGGPADPNKAYARTLGEAEQKAYNETLMGPENPFDYETETEEYNAFYLDFEHNAGCMGKALAQSIAESPTNLVFDDEFAPLFDGIRDFRNNLSLDPIQADREWAVCMNDAGYPGYDARPDFRQYFSERQRQVSDDLFERLGNDKFTSWPVSPAESPEIQAVLDQEIETALADLGCRIATDYDARQQAHVIELETQFVKDHQSQFEALKSAIEQLS